MDSFTQIALGAAVGEAIAGKKLGNKALLYGAIAGTIPDLDVFIGNAMNTVDALSFHRGFSHSIAFALICSPTLGLVMRRIYSKQSATFQDWTWLFFLGFFTHALLDCFTTWGTQLLWPLNYRIAFKSIFVIDPLYTVPLTICLIWLSLLPRESTKRLRLNQVGLAISSLYLISSVIIKQHINTVFERSFEHQNLKVERYDTRPAPLNTILWAVNAEVAEGYYIGYYSILDNDQQINYFFFPKNHELLLPYSENEKIKQLSALTDGWYSLEASEDGIIFNDLRFGQRTGWIDEKGDFVFSYLIHFKNGQIQIDEIEKSMEDGKAIAAALWNRTLGIP